MLVFTGGFFRKDEDMKKYLLMNDKKRFKANMHCHTNISDGVHTPEEIKALYVAQGYNIVAFTDHNVLQSHEYLNDDKFLAINACEVDISQTGKAWNETRTYHFNLYATKPNMRGTPPLPTMDYDDITAINKYIADRISEGFLVCYNHPYWSLQTQAEYSRLKGCFAMEIYNHGCEVEGFYGYNPQAYDEMLRAGQRAHCLSVDDNHNAVPDSFGGYIQISSQSLSYENIIQSLKNGDFYSSQGPEIYEISLNGNELTVICSDVEAIVVFTQGRKCFVENGKGITGARFQLDGSEGYIRVICRDNDKKDANSNAYWLI